MVVFWKLVGIGGMWVNTIKEKVYTFHKNIHSNEYIVFLINLKYDSFYNIEWCGTMIINYIVP